MKNVYLTRVVQVRELGDPSLELENKKISSSLEASRIVMEKLKLGEEAEEHFIILGLDTKNQINCISLISKGSLNSSIVHPREVFKPAILSNCSSIILAHNHPSGIVDPSEEDILVTQRLSNVGRVMGIDVLDHIIVGHKGYFSFKEEGIINNNSSSNIEEVLEEKEELVMVEAKHKITEVNLDVEGSLKL